MRCHECGNENRAGIRFCEECGTRLEASCPACGATVPLDRKFCGACGELLTVPAAVASAGLRAAPLLTSRIALEGERKQVTVLFADLRGSLELLAGRDPEEARKMLDPVLLVLMDSVHRYEGTVNQVLGDGIMALFGAPVTHEDHAVRACLAALDMQESVRRQADSLRIALGVDVKVRIGLNSGEVVVRSIGSDLRMDYTAVGETTHLAGRMEQLAQPGAILLTAATHRLTHGYVDARPLGPIPVKGLTEPVEVFELRGVGAVRTRLQASRTRGLTRFVGREVELAELRRARDHAAAGHGQVVAVVGEPGVGKSRLVLEFLGDLASPAWLALDAPTTSFGRAAPYLPIVALLRAYFGVADSDDPREIQTKIRARLSELDLSLPVALAPLSVLLGAPANDSRWDSLNPTQRQQQTLEAVTQLLIRTAASRTLCVVVEDLHWIDPASQAMLDRFIESIPAARVLVILTYRPEYQHRWSNRSYYAQLPINPLPRAIAAELLEDLLGPAPGLERVKTLLVERSEGNPFFLEECVWNLVETQVLVGQRGDYRLTKPGVRLEVPPSVQTVLAARMDRLAPGAKQLLQTAAVIGKDVPLALLEAVADMDEPTLRRCLGQLQAGEFLYETSLLPALQYTFKHALTLEVAYGSLLRERRRALDARIVEALERQDGERRGDHVERLAHHAVRGEVWDKAVIHCREAGARAFAHSAHRAAVDHFEQALSALQHLPESPSATEQAIDVRLDLRYALTPTAEYRRIIDYLQEAEDLAEAAGDQQRLGLISSHLANYFNLIGSLNRSVERGERALSIAERLQNLPLQVVATAYLVSTYYRLGDYARAVTMARRNITALQGHLRSQRFGMASLPAVYSRTFLGWALAELGEFAEALGPAAEALEIAEAAEHSYSLVYACLGVGMVHLRQGTFDLAIPPLERAVGLCLAADIPVLQSIATVPLASAYSHSGRTADALRVIEAAARAADQIGDPMGGWVRTGALAEAYVLAGRAADALPLAQRYLEQRRRLGGRGYEAAALRLLAHALSQLEPPADDSAQTAYDDALALAVKLGMRPLVGHCHLGLARLHRRMGRVGEARAQAATAAELFRSTNMTFWAAEAEREIRDL